MQFLRSPLGVTPCEREEAVDAFTKWCRRSKVLFPKAKIAHSLVTGRWDRNWGRS